MRIGKFDYFLPPELIAQEPLASRDAARLMTLERSSGAIGETVITEISALLRDGDLLVLNDTRVIPARLFGAKESGGKVEILLVRRLTGPDELWRCLLRASKPPKVGARIILPDGVTAQVEEQDAGEQWTVSFDPAEGFEEWLGRNGAMPLPPYIKRAADDCDRERYQTVFAKVSGAVAAPTAGLHFTPELLEAILNRRVDIVPLTLHVGLGTFLPVRVEELQHHRMHREYYNIPTATAEAINRRKREGGRVVAVG
ncbi:MAG: tRNA preQ1(34) S-adenosylmethionine ribosyltransferase-isomerase QueA, partial [Geobacteraceae bacterium]